MRFQFTQQRKLRPGWTLDSTHDFNILYHVILLRHLQHLLYLLSGRISIHVTISITTKIRNYRKYVLIFTHMIVFGLCQMILSSFFYREKVLIHVTVFFITYICRKISLVLRSPDLYERFQPCTSLKNVKF